ncbi:MAG: hypothetical protein MPK10_05220 [Gammaproteobacteria bacterium]|nr:hypothetical protein [Gammaproteobacteria bacterium]
MKYLPLHLDFSGRRCVVIGGGALAERRARQLLEAGARGGFVALGAGRELRSLITSRGGGGALRGDKAVSFTHLTLPAGGLV